MGVKRQRGDIKNGVRVKWSKPSQVLYCGFVVSTSMAKVLQRFPVTELATKSKIHKKFDHTTTTTRCCNRNDCADLESIGPGALKGNLGRLLSLGCTRIILRTPSKIYTVLFDTDRTKTWNLKFWGWPPWAGKRKRIDRLRLYVPFAVFSIIPWLMLRPLYFLQQWGYCQLIFEPRYQLL